ncbi:DUF1365 domain-containing protein [Syntrophotalea acetylenica]|uniref:DUF1365 domain-containing protein n=2 Tax=Syntrophotalea TaxID=2812025 RepID=A0A1L3GCP2_SYNAC|nr:DUF1365 domain-containing protein [Syntrophotalea acetylenica]APG23721.1 hypothetical protein A7E75_00780 [Syntrophotalea acetylenica]APG44298.1 hypothetical protein A6070_09390 [Syntrophotalea acetylenica]
MNSCAYVCRLKHDRPNKNRFAYKIYMFYLDLDEIDLLADRFKLLGKNRWNLLSFYDDDHFLFVRQKGKRDRIARATFDYTREYYVGKSTKERVRETLGELGFDFELGKVCLLTSLRNLGYIFNPVSFYYCYDAQGELRVLLSEVNNTYRDQKLFYTALTPGNKRHRDKQKKNFYVSPFIDMDTEITWSFEEPAETLLMEVNSVKDGQAILKTSLAGDRRQLSSTSILLLFLRYPMVPLFTIIFIHWQALKLWLKKVRFRDKSTSDDEIIRGLR